MLLPDLEPHHVRPPESFATSFSESDEFGDAVMESRLENCGVCGRRFEEVDIVVWSHGELFHRRCALGADGSASQPDDSKRDPGV